MFFILSTGHLNWNSDQQKSRLQSVTWIIKHLFKVSSPKPKSFDSVFSKLSTVIWRHATKKIEVYPKQTKGKCGCKPKLNKLNERSIIRALHYARKQDGNLTLKRIKLYSGVSSVHSRTIWRLSNKYGYHYQQARCVRDY